MDIDKKFKLNKPLKLIYSVFTIFSLTKNAG